ncbi:MAG: Ig-like domain-containing protein [Elusimicrobia bacterium]|nr:Ig-like domain-containing protein [Elusimicrobiota bacterium]
MHPKEGDVLIGTVSVAANPGDDCIVERVEYLFDGQFMTTPGVNSYNFILQTSSYAPGVHHLEARVYDLKGKQNKEEILVYLSSVPVPESEVRKYLPAEKGGTVSHPGNHKLVLPPTALGSDTIISMEELSELPIHVLPAPPFRTQQYMVESVPHSRPLKLGPEGTYFSKPVTLTIAYSTQNLNYFDDRFLSIAYWNPKFREWEFLDSAVNSREKTVSV